VNVWFQNIHTHPIHVWSAIKTSIGGGESKKAKPLKESMKLNWNFLEGWGEIKITHGRGRDICWNDLIRANVNLASLEG